MKSNSCYKFLLLLLLLCGAGWASAQTSTVKVTGTLLTQEGKPLDYATVSLLQAKDSAIVKGSLSNERGLYTFNGVKAGSYIIKATAVAYNKTVSKVFEVTNSDITLPALSLTPASKALKEVTVTGTQPIVQRQADRLVVNVANSSLAAGNNALDILQKSPGITLDKDDNISLNGKKGVTVMINDKLTYLSAAQLATLLRSTDGNTIQSVEIITNPSAKYDAAGNSGIINIKLKKNKQVGTNGNIVAGVAKGRFFRDNTSLSLNHRQGKLNLFTTLDRNDNKRYQLLDLDRIVTDSLNNKTYFSQRSYMPSTNHNNSYRVGADYDLSAKNTVGVIVSGYYNPGKDNNENTTYIGRQPQVFDTYQTTGSTINNVNRNFALNLNDRYQIDTLGQQLGIDLDYSKFRNSSNALYTTNYFLTNGNSAGLPFYLRQLTPSEISIRTGKADYTYPLSKTLKLETGAKFSNVKTDNDLQALTSNDNTNYTLNTTLSNHFIYTEKISAGYINLSKTYKNTSIQAGLRGEYTSSVGTLVSSSSTPPVDRHYFNLFPSVFINHTINSKNQVGLNYSRRIDRPSYQDLNPFTYYLDQYTYSQGNPFLKPQYTNNFELNYTYNQNLNVTVGYAHTSDAITEVLITNVETKATYQTVRNLSTQNAYNLNANYSFTVNKWWSGQANGSLFYLGFKTDSLIGRMYNNGQLAYNLKLTQNFLVAKKYKFELLSSYESPLVYSIYNVQHHLFFDAGVSRSFADKKVNLKFSVSDIFYTLRDNVSSHYATNDFEIRQRRDSRVARLTFTYNFGNNKIKGSNHRSGADEERGRVKGAN